MRLSGRIRNATSAVVLAVVTARIAEAAPLVFDTREPGRERELRRYMIESPRPPYPVSARIHQRTGTGLYRIIFNKRGRVTAVTAIKSTGHKDLDQAAAYGFYRWRCQPGKVDQVVVPVTFTKADGRRRGNDTEHVY